MSTEIRLVSPVGAAPAIFQWPFTSAKSGQAMKETESEIYQILQTIRWVYDDFPDMRSALSAHVILGEAPRYLDYETLRDTCERYNRAVEQFLAENRNRIDWVERTHRRASRNLLRYIMTIVYNRSVTDPEKLNQYEPFSPEVYGETSFDLVCQMLEEASIRESDIFIDLGSGVGQVVLQVAASVQCKLCYGIEKADWPALYAQNMQKEFNFWMKWFGKTYSEYTIDKGDFLIETVKEKINEAALIFVNNFAFGAEVDHQLKLRFANMREGAKIVSSKAFCPMNFRLTDRNLNDIGAIMSVSELSPLRGNVSWTGKPVTYYLHTIDRTLLEKYFERLKNPKLKDEEDKDRKEKHKHKVHHATEEELTLYGATTRRQWAEFVGTKPEKVEKPHNTHTAATAISANSSASAANNKSNSESQAKKHAAKVQKKYSKLKAQAKANSSTSTLDLFHNSAMQATLGAESVGFNVAQMSKLESSNLDFQELSECSTSGHGFPATVEESLERYLDDCRQRFLEFMTYMKSSQYRSCIMHQIEREKQAQEQLKKKIENIKKQIDHLVTDSTDLLKLRLQEIGMFQVETPVDLINQAKSIVTHHTQLKEQVSTLQATVADLEREQDALLSQYQNYVRNQVNRMSFANGNAMVDPEKITKENLLREIVNEIYPSEEVRMAHPANADMGMHSQLFNKHMGHEMSSATVPLPSPQRSPQRSPQKAQKSAQKLTSPHAASRMSEVHPAQHTPSPAVAAAAPPAPAPAPSGPADSGVTRENGPTARGNGPSGDDAMEPMMPVSPLQLRDIVESAIVGELNKCKKEELTPTQANDQSMSSNDLSYEEPEKRPRLADSSDSMVEQARDVEKRSLHASDLCSPGRAARASQSSSVLIETGIYSPVKSESDEDSPFKRRSGGKDKGQRKAKESKQTPPAARTAVTPPTTPAVSTPGTPDAAAFPNQKPGMPKFRIPKAKTSATKEGADSNINRPSPLAHRSPVTPFGPEMTAPFEPQRKRRTNFKEKGAGGKKHKQQQPPPPQQQQQAQQQQPQHQHQHQQQQPQHHHQHQQQAQQQQPQHQHQHQHQQHQPPPQQQQPQQQQSKGNHQGPSSGARNLKALMEQSSAPPAASAAPQKTVSPAEPAPHRDGGAGRDRHPVAAPRAPPANNSNDLQSHVSVNMLTTLATELTRITTQLLTEQAKKTEAPARGSQPSSGGPKTPPEPAPESYMSHRVSTPPGSPGAASDAGSGVSGRSPCSAASSVHSKASAESSMSISSGEHVAAAQPASSNSPGAAASLQQHLNNAGMLPPHMFAQGAFNNNPFGGGFPMLSAAMAGLPSFHALGQPFPGFPGAMQMGCPMPNSGGHAPNQRPNSTTSNKRGCMPLNIDSSLLQRPSSLNGPCMSSKPMAAMNPAGGMMAEFQQNMGDPSACPPNMFLPFGFNVAGFHSGQHLQSRPPVPNRKQSF